MAESTFGRDWIWLSATRTPRRRGERRQFRQRIFRARLRGFAAGRLALRAPAREVQADQDRNFFGTADKGLLLVVLVDALERRARRGSLRCRGGGLRGA